MLMRTCYTSISPKPPSERARECRYEHLGKIQIKVYEGNSDLFIPKFGDGEAMVTRLKRRCHVHLLALPMRGQQNDRSFVPGQDLIATSPKVDFYFRDNLYDTYVFSISDAKSKRFLWWCVVPVRWCGGGGGGVVPLSSSLNLFEPQINE